MMTQKKSLLALICIMLVLTVSACGHSANSSSAGTSAGDESKVTIEMNEAQKKFLVGNVMDTEAVESGHLTDWQIELLNQYDYCIEYLSEKYEGHSFEITTCDISNPSFTKFVVIPDEDENKVFTVNVFDEEGQFSANDTFM